MASLSEEHLQRIRREEPERVEKILRAVETITPQHYICYRTCGPMVVDGNLDEPSWKKAPWTELFGHIEDEDHVPCLATRAKMLWDDDYFYVAADLEDPDVWGTFTKRDSPICGEDTDFEVFIDPDGDGQNYMEFEQNALNCVWDLLLDQPHHRGGNPDNDWDYQGIKSAVQVQGTLNAPWIVDKGWTVEVAFDWASMKPQAVGISCPPSHGDIWRVNMSRLHRNREKSFGFDWTWSRQGIYSMHVPEMYGRVEFSEKEVGATCHTPAKAD
jgi:hypothetical protein